MSPAARKPSMIDVAERAGVSYQTVSRVLNDPSRVRESTRERVVAAIQELGFTRNLAARALKTRSSSIIGVVTDGSPLFGPATTTAAIERAAREEGFSTLLAGFSAGAEAAPDIATEFLEHGVEGAIVVAAHDAMLPALESLTARTPVVTVSAMPRAVLGGARSIGVDQELGARFVIEHLAATGHRSVVHLQGPVSWFDARSRMQGFTAAVERSGLDGDATRPMSWSAADGYEWAMAIPRTALPDAIFAANDQLALGAIRALGARSIRVPEDVSVVGFDDIEGSAYFSPPLTTVRQPFANLGWAAVRLVTSEAERERSEISGGLLPPVLVERDSVRPR